jgi:hypothetical protein
VEESQEEPARCEEPQGICTAIALVEEWFKNLLVPAMVIGPGRAGVESHPAIPRVSTSLLRRYRPELLPGFIHLLTELRITCHLLLNLLYRVDDR